MSDHNRPFSDEERAGLYRAIYARRDVRSQFLPDRIPADVLARILKAASNYTGNRWRKPLEQVGLSERLKNT